MRRMVLVSAALAAVFLSSVAPAWAVTEKQAIVMPVLDAIKLKQIKSDVIGGPVKYRITRETLDLLKKAMDDGKIIILESDGTIKFEKE